MNRSKKKISLTLFISSTLVLAFLFINRFIKNNQEPDELIPVRYGSVKAVVEVPAHVAYTKGFFEKEGLDVHVEINPDGKTSLERVLSDSIDIASVMATPVVYKSFERNDFYIFGVVEFSEKIHSCIAHLNSGIVDPTDLKNKNVGVMKGTSGEFFMNSFLIAFELLPSDLNIINLNGPAMVEAMVNKELDAMFCWEPYPVIAARNLNNNIIKIESEQLVPSTWVFVAKKEYVNKNPEVIIKFLKSILAGMNFTNSDKESSLQYHAELANIDKSVVWELLNKEIYNLSLKQDLLLDLEAQARWLIDFNYVSVKTVPDFLDIIYTEAIENVVPNEVLIIKQ